MRVDSRARPAAGRTPPSARAGLVLACALAAIAASGPAHARPAGSNAVVELRRTTDGVPHVRATSWHGLGLGVGYAQAQDALCTLADGFLTYEGRRSAHFGPEARPPHDSMLGRPTNLELDIFFRGFADADMLARQRAAQPPALQQLVQGYAAGYNRYLREARGAAPGAAARSCLNEPWVREISADDVYRRFYAAQIGAGYARFIPQIVKARPAPVAATAAPRAAGERPAWLVPGVGRQAGLGSNALAFGRTATGEDGGVLLGNPHWYWGGPDRFYQMHLTLPGQLDVAGVAFLGVPVVMIGFNDQVAWSHTVSAARRFGLFDLTLDAADATRYQVDGVNEAMQARTVAVEVRGADGRLSTVTRTLYRSRQGPVVDLGAWHPALGWAGGHAVALRDANAENFRVFRNYLAWNQARSLEDFIAIQRREAALPWVNTLAIGRGDPRAWYADLGVVPATPDALRAACATPLSRGFAALDGATPFLDGSRSACDWQHDAAAVQPGTLPAAALPTLLREDYVANMNDSYWLGNPQQPLEGFPAVLGGERQALSLRGRQGHRLAERLMRSAGGSSLRLSQALMRESLAARSHSAELFKDDLLDAACGAPALATACQVLRSWPGTAQAQDRGALLWDAFWEQLEKTVPPQQLWRVPFSAAAPLDTPRDPDGSDPRVAQALEAAQRSLADRGVALDAPVGQQRLVRSGGREVPLYGACQGGGYFAVACNYDGSWRMGPDSIGNTYLQVVRFGRHGVEAHTLLAHGQDEAAVDNGPGEAPVLRYARQDWLAFPFREEEIARDPGLTRLLLQP